MLKTLVYADIFDYPLTDKEIKRWHIAGDKNSKKSNIVEKTGNYYHLPGRSQLVALRQKRSRFSQLKWQRVNKIAKLLKLIPWIKVIAVTGALAMKNTNKDDDIDLMIITKNNRLWLTRLTTLFLLEVVGSRRRYGSSKIQDKICPNLFLDESSLALPPNRRNLYTAHEVAQVRVIFEKDNTHQKFIDANLWLKKFLPNWSR